MTQEEAVNKNLDLSFEFDRYLFEHPQIPDNAVVVLLPEYDQKNREPNQPLVLVEIASLRPQKSRLVRPKLKVENDLKTARSRARQISNGRKIKKKAIVF
ncbi:MAG: hypothetical protein ONB46_18790 [candidate division KSB1 bacterium]|nr:hypothetical protein [candidate division KSB1 bacterium]MDZ7367929.1 hypothetical protein [candidate division KSB1 bacterium]MDZ7406504.1 hypothetical protein [candidate division KSB1 bacterium]